jgi:hypothetical protein
MKKSFIIIVALMFAGAIYAGDQSLQVQKDEIWEMAKLYKQDNENRAVRLPSAPKANIARPVYHARKVKSGAAAAVVQEDNKPRVYTFDATTAWGTYKAEVIEYPGEAYFDVTFESQQPIQGLVIRDQERKMDVYTCGLAEVTTPDKPIRINYAYKPIYLLVLKADIDDVIQPQIIPLFKRSTTKSAN